MKRKLMLIIFAIVLSVFIAKPNAVNANESTINEANYWSTLDKTQSNIVIPNGILSIPDYAFKYCDSLESVTISSTVKSIGDCAFLGCSSLTSITIPSSVTSIGDFAFKECEFLTSITIPSSVTSIGDYAFYGCSSLTSITIPSSVLSIGNSAFASCKSLTSITIPSSVTSIGSYAYSNCSNLRCVYIVSNNKEMNVEESIFNGSNNVNIYTDYSTIPTSWNSNWNKISYNNAYAPVELDYSYEDFDNLLTIIEFTENYWNTLDKTQPNIVITDGVLYIPNTAFMVVLY